MRKIKMFHGTADTRIHRILLEGLKCKAEQGSRIFENGQKRKAICLTKSKKLAQLYANRKCNSLGKGHPVIITLTVPENQLLECTETLGGEVTIDKAMYCSLTNLPRDYIKHIDTTRFMNNWDILGGARRFKNGK